MDSSVAYHRPNPAAKHALSDSPDFQCTIAGVNGEPSRWFWGDIGHVSASAFSMTVGQMDVHDLWISVWSSTQQIVLEPLVSLSDMFASMFAGAPIDWAQGGHTLLSALCPALGIPMMCS